MKNIFIELGKTKALLKQEPLLKLLEHNEDEETPLPPLIEQYFDNQDDPSNAATVEFILKLIALYPQPDIKEKLFALLVYFVAKLPLPESTSILRKVEGLNESIFTRVRFFSLLYKSSNHNELKKQLITASIGLIDKETKISIFSNFVQNFDRLIASLTFSHNEYVQIFLKLINYLEKHAVYKKLSKHYIVQCLLNVAPDHVQSPEVDSLFLKLLKSNQVSEETVSLAHKTLLTKNRFYNYLEALLLGDFQKFAQLPKQPLTQAGITHSELERRVKVHAIPRILSGSSNNIATIVSYQQIAEILHIQKDEVEGYIIEAIQQGILKAKIDQSSETIIINSVKFMALRTEERASLQKNISLFAARLQETASH